MIYDYKSIIYPVFCLRLSGSFIIKHNLSKVSFFVQFTKTQLITFQNVNIQTFFSQFLQFFSLKCSSKGQIISRIHLGLSNACKLMCFGRKINGNRNVKFLECDYLLVQRCVKLSLVVFLKLSGMFRQRLILGSNTNYQDF